ncbi:MAG: serine protease [Thiohalocapsa sp.]
MRLSPSIFALLSLAIVLCLILAPRVAIADLPATVTEVKPSVVAVGTYLAIRQQQKQPSGTGFVVAGSYVVTNSHVVPKKLDEDRRESVAVYLPGPDNRVLMRKANLVADDPEHDLALLRFEGGALPSLRLGNAKDVREGELAAFTGYPVLNALGLYPATHRATIAAISPVALPVSSGEDLTANMIKRLSAPFNVFQLDAVAYPGNSGSPLYETDTGQVIGIINSVYVKKTKEAAISAPSGISYAIPVDHLRALLKKAGVSP